MSISVQRDVLEEEELGLIRHSREAEQHWAGWSQQLLGRVGHDCSPRNQHLAVN